MRHFFILLILIYAATSDIKTLEVPNRCFILILLCTNQLSLNRIISFTLVFLIYLVIVLIYSLLDKDVPIGMADAKIFAALSFSLGINKAITIFIYSSLASGLYAASLLILRLIHAKSLSNNNGSTFLQTEIPFVPFITLGMLTACLLSQV